MFNLSPKTKFAITSGVAAFVTVLALGAGAQAEEPVCYGQYGQVIQCPIINKSFSIEKQVIDGATLKEEIRGIKPGGEVKFNLTVANTGQLTVSGLTVVDNLPANLTFVSLNLNGVAVTTTVDQTSYSWVIDNFAPGNSLSYVLTTKANDTAIVKGSEKCVVNVGNVFYRGIKEGSNTATVCISNPNPQVLSAQLPETASNIQIFGGAVVALGFGGLLFVVRKLLEELIR